MTRELPSSIERMDYARRGHPRSPCRSPFSIATGSAFGLVSDAEIKLLAGGARRVGAVVVLAALLFIKFTVLYARAFPVCPKKAMGCTEFR
jgi:hypothetical protein